MNGGVNGYTVTYWQTEKIVHGGVYEGCTPCEYIANIRDLPVCTRICERLLADSQAAPAAISVQAHR